MKVECLKFAKQWTKTVNDNTVGIYFNATCVV
jgi:hypothetical protein